VTPKVEKVKTDLGDNIIACIVLYHLQRLRVKEGGEEGGGNCEHNNENSSFLKRDNLLSTWGKTSFCRQTPFHEVSYLFELKKKNLSRKIKILSSNLVCVGPGKIMKKDRASGPRQRKDIILFNYQNLVAYVTYNWMVR